MDEAPHAVGEAINRLGSELLAIGYAEPGRSSPTVRLACLWAVEQLRSMGATLPRAVAAETQHRPDRFSSAVGAIGAVRRAIGAGDELDLADVLSLADVLDMVEIALETAWVAG
jgi:hypothetical protein